jgi:hypothetical protein
MSTWSCPRGGRTDMQVHQSDLQVRLGLSAGHRDEVPSVTRPLRTPPSLSRRFPRAPALLTRVTLDSPLHNPRSRSNVY